MKKTPIPLPMFVCISFALAAALVLNPVVFSMPPRVPAQNTERPQDSARALKIKIFVQQHGVGEKSRVKVMLRNHAEVKGYISGRDETSFSVTDQKTNAATTISYSEVEKIAGSGLSNGVKIGIAVGVVVILVAIISVVTLCGSATGFCGTAK